MTETHSPGSTGPAQVQMQVQPGHPPVGGWLLALCLLLTVVGPVVTVGLLAHGDWPFALHLAAAPGRQLALGLAGLVDAAGAALGAYAGWRLWAVRPGAVATAKTALLWGLAANAVAAALLLVAGPTSAADGPLLHQFTLRLIPDITCFTACFAYLNKSRRVHNTYRL